MDMHAAALPPRSGNYSKQDQAHPLFKHYQIKLNSCARLMIDAPDFQDWLFQYDRETESDNAAKSPDYPAFLAWCQETKSGKRKCCPTKDNPNGLCFPHNFYFWQSGGRW